MSSNDQHLVKVEHPDAATVALALNRPEKRNALSIALIDRLREAIEQASADRKKRVLILRGEGPVFCAGLDLQEIGDPSRAEQSAQSLSRLYAALCDTPLVTIACAHGAAMGGGAGFIAAADFVLGADDLQIGFPEVRRGLVAALVTALLRRHLGDRVVREIILLGQTLDARRSAELGLVTAIVTPARLEEEAMQMSRDLCRGAPNSIVRSKRLLDELAPRRMADDLQIALRYHMESRSDTEHDEGVRAFREKRDPVWGERAE